MQPLRTHRRYNALTGQWVLVCSNRNKRPWQGAQDSPSSKQLAAYDDTCYLCPGNQRVNGKINPNYPSTFYFRNDFSALTEQTQLQRFDDDLLQAEEVNGHCEVLCFSPRHDLTLADMAHSDIVDVIDIWQQRFVELTQTYHWVQLFENKGSAMGCSNPHPHGQIWASNFIPNEVQREQQQLLSYYKKHQSNLLLDYVERELVERDRVIEENEHWLIVVPYWATWPFETLLLPKTLISSWQQCLPEHKAALALIIKSLLQRYDRLFNVSFPYSMGWHCAPANCENPSAWLLHAHYYPPLLRSESVKKFMVGYEMLAEQQRDFTPEKSAEILQGVSI